MLGVHVCVCASMRALQLGVCLPKSGYLSLDCPVSKSAICRYYVCKNCHPCFYISNTCTSASLSKAGNFKHLHKSVLNAEA